MKITLKKKISLVTLLCLLIPSIIIMLMSGFFSVRLIQERETLAASESLHVTQANITNVMNAAIETTNSIQFDADLIAQLKKPYSGAAHSDEALEKQLLIENKLDELTSYKKGIYITILHASDDSYYSNYGYYQFNPTQFRKEPWFAELSTLDPYGTYYLGVQPSYISPDKENHPYVISVARTLRDVTYKPIAYVIVSIHETDFRSIIMEYSQSQDIMLLSSDGVVQSGANKVGERVAFFDEISRSEPGALTAIQGKKYIVVKQKLPFADWTLVSLTPHGEVTSELYTLFRFNVLIEAGFVLLFLCILMYLLHQMTKPISHLVRVAGRIEDGRLDVRSQIKGSDEFDLLSRSFNKMLDSIQNMVTQVKNEQEMKRKAELAMLQAQINPHFLFNILNAVRLRILLNGDRDNADMISSLTHLLRMTFNRWEFVPLKEEIYIVTEYLKMMNYTSKHRFKEEIHLSEDMLNVMIPRFLLQPIIENAIIHGLKQQEGIIVIRAWREQGRLNILIQDDGQGISHEALTGLRERLCVGLQGAANNQGDEQGMSGIGLSNVYERLQLIYGAQAQLFLESEPGMGTAISIIIPEGEVEHHVESANCG